MSIPCSFDLTPKNGSKRPALARPGSGCWDAAEGRLELVNLGKCHVGGIVGTKGGQYRPELFIAQGGGEGRETGPMPIVVIRTTWGIVL